MPLENYWVVYMNAPLIYFNNAATSWPKPNIVHDMVSSSFQQPYHEHGRATDENLNDYPKMTRKKLSDFFHIETPNNFIFTSNATDSLNLLIHGYIQSYGREIHAITTELEHNSVLRPLNTLQKQGAIDLTIIPFDDAGYVSLDTIRCEVRDTTKLVVMNHGSNVLGTTQDIESIGQYLSEQNIFFVVDAAQTAGHLEIDLNKTAVDAIAFTGHKSLYGYQGIGGLYIKYPEKVESFKQGGTGVYSQYPYHPTEMPLKFEFGTLNYPGIVSLYAGLDFIEAQGIRSMNEKTHSMIYHIIKELSRMENIILYTKQPDLPIVSFNIEGMDNDDVGFILQKEFNIMTRTGLHCAPLVHKRIDNGRGCIRVSLSYFNSMAECDTFINAIEKITKTIIATNTV